MREGKEVHRGVHTRTHTQTHLTIGDASSDDSGAVVSTKTDDHHTVQHFPSVMDPIGEAGFPGVMQQGRVRRSGKASLVEHPLLRLNVPELGHYSLSLESVRLGRRDKLGGGSRVVDFSVGVLEISDELCVCPLDVRGHDVILIDERHAVGACVRGGINKQDLQTDWIGCLWWYGRSAFSSYLSDGRSTSPFQSGSARVPVPLRTASVLPLLLSSTHYLSFNGDSNRAAPNPPQRREASQAALPILSLSLRHVEPAFLACM